jgi:hypothetical protein
MVENIEWQPFPAFPPAARPDHLFITTALRTLVIANRTVVLSMSRRAVDSGRAMHALHCGVG